MLDKWQDQLDVEEDQNVVVWSQCLEVEINFLDVLNYGVEQQGCVQLKCGVFIVLQYSGDVEYYKVSDRVVLGVVNCDQLVFVNEQIQFVKCCKKGCQCDE